MGLRFSNIDRRASVVLAAMNVVATGAVLLTGIDIARDSGSSEWQSLQVYQTFRRLSLRRGEMMGVSEHEIHLDCEHLQLRVWWIVASV